MADNGPEALNEGNPENRPLLSQQEHSISAGDDGAIGLAARTNVVNRGVEFEGTEARNEIENSLLRKVDRRMSILILIYILNYIDRNNVAAARLRGFEEDLRLEGTQFASILSALYIGYILMQIPSNMFLDYVGKPSIYLPCCMILWGGISFFTGFVTRFSEALFARFLLGFVEAAFFPGALFLISKWYKRNELSQRIALLSCGNLVSNAFGSLIASAILDGLDGVLNYAAWRWLFFVEGALTIFVAIWAIYILPDFPDSPSSWLTPNERALAQQRMIEDARPNDAFKSLTSDLGSTIQTRRQASISGFILALSDWKVWWLALSLTSMVVSLSFNAYFPTLSATMGFDTTTTLLLCVPPWAFATIVSLAVSRHSDNTGERCWHITIPLLIGMMGFLIAMSTMNTVIRYFSLFLMAQTYAGFICFLSWTSGTISRPSSKRAVALAFVNSVSSLGNVTGSYVWPTSWGPTYYNSYTICTITGAITVVMCFAFRSHLASLNDMEERKEKRHGEKKGYRYIL
ncbi:MFS general substrate transporter [Collybia nuda]|uniref:MFS general substrate transporter n=1 Tax=Collybia nuda TaxID=64659 RepID=A0A9P5Y6J1_9AGAR|nr:MFS general substrate transporter [Collybia nuda]